MTNPNITAVSLIKRYGERVGIELWLAFEYLKKDEETVEDILNTFDNMSEQQALTFIKKELYPAINKKFEMKWR